MIGVKKEAMILLVRFEPGTTISELQTLESLTQFGTAGEIHAGKQHLTDADC